MKKQKQKSIKTLKSQLWKTVSIIVRSSGADWRGNVACYTCGVPYQWKEMNAGHFKHNKLDFDLRNLKPQCVKCNLWGRGKLDVYGVKLVRQYGMAWVTKLEQDAAQKGNNYSREELLKLTAKYNALLKKLKV